MRQQKGILKGLSPSSGCRAVPGPGSFRRERCTPSDQPLRALDSTVGRRRGFLFDAHPECGPRIESARRAAKQPAGRGTGCRHQSLFGGDITSLHYRRSPHIRSLPSVGAAISRPANVSQPLFGSDITSLPYRRSPRHEFARASLCRENPYRGFPSRRRRAS